MKASKTVEIPASILGVTISTKDRELLKSGKETSLISGFTNKDGHKFDAFLSLNSENKLVFRFESPEEARGDEYTAYKKDINLALFAKHIGFKFEKGFSTTGDDHFEYVLLSNRENSSIIVYLDDSTMEYRFFQLSKPSVSGTLLDFLYIFKALTKDEIGEEIKKSKILSSLSDEEIELVPIKGNYEEAFLKLNQLVPLNNPDLFHEQFIKESTYEHTFFRGRIFNKKTDKEKSQPCFPLFHKEQYAGLYYSSTFEDPIAPQHDGIWYSNIINDQKIRRIIIFENPVDALSYHQLHSKPSDLFTVYLATCGLDIPNQLIEIQHIIDTYKPEQLYLATLQSLEGKLQTISLLGQLSEPRMHIEKLNAVQDENSEILFELNQRPDRVGSTISMNVRLSYPDMEKGIFMNENLLKYFHKINLKEVEERPEIGDQVPFQATIHTIGRHSSLAEINFARKPIFLEIAEKIVQHLRPVLFVKTLYPQSINYREDLRLANENKSSLKENKVRRLG